MSWKGFVLDCRWQIQLPTINLVNVHCLPELQTKIVYYVTETFSKYHLIITSDVLFE